MVMMLCSYISTHPPEPVPPQIISTTFKAEGVHLGSSQLKDLKTLAVEQDKQKTKATADKDWHGLLNCAQYLFWDLFIPIGLAHLLCYLLAVYHAPAYSETTLFAKVLMVGHKKSLEATG